MNKQIEGYDNYYCNSLGDVFSIRKKLKKSKRNGYECITLCNKGVCKTITVHRIIAKLFIPNPFNKPQVNHIDGNRSNNKIENLEWCTPKENYAHAKRTGLIKNPICKNRKDLSKPINQFLDGVLINTFLSMNEAMRITGVQVKWISACCNGGSYRLSGGIKKWIKCYSAGGYTWQEVKQEIEKL